MTAITYDLNRVPSNVVTEVQCIGTVSRALRCVAASVLVDSDGKVMNDVMNEILTSIVGPLEDLFMRPTQLGPKGYMSIVSRAFGVKGADYIERDGRSYTLKEGAQERMVKDLGNFDFVVDTLNKALLAATVRHEPVAEPAVDNDPAPSEDDVVITAKTIKHLVDALPDNLVDTEAGAILKDVINDLIYRVY